jgi:hypothetical protein
MCGTQGTHLAAGQQWKGSRMKGQTLPLEWPSAGSEGCSCNTWSSHYVRCCAVLLCRHVGATAGRAAAVHNPLLRHVQLTASAGTPQQCCALWATGAVSALGASTHKSSSGMCGCSVVCAAHWPCMLPQYGSEQPQQQPGGCAMRQQQQGRGLQCWWRGGVSSISSRRRRSRSGSPGRGMSLLAATTYAAARQ